MQPGNVVYVIVVVPAATPVTLPVAAATVAVPVAAMAHVPPGVADDKSVLLPTQTAVVPVIAAGMPTTVTVVAA
jgi:hypothetical protein